MFKHHQSKPGYYRAWLNLGLPENPWCWAFGHAPRPVITEWQYSAPSLWIDCRVCGRRYREDDRAGYIEQQAREEGVSRKDAIAALTARRIENARRLPAAEFCADVNRRTGWADRKLELHHEVHWPSRKPDAKRRGYGKFGAKLHIGGQGSETPFDGHVTAGPFGYYWSIGGIGGRFASWLGRGHKRDLALSVHGGHLWWKVWYDDDGGNDPYHVHDLWAQPRLWPWSRGRRKHRSWMCLRNGSIRLNPFDELWGPAKPTRVPLMEDGEVTVLAVPVAEFPGDTYLVDVTLERWTWAREHGPAWARRVADVHHSAEWRADGEGIPFRNHSWKGDGVIASGVRLPDPLPSDWRRIVVESIVASVKRDRRRYNYSPPRVP